MHVVLADDHRLVADALILYLTKLRSDIEVTRAGNFEDAMERISESTDLDFVILDMAMPGMDGLDGLKLMRAQFPDLTIVMLSGVASPQDVREALDQGAAGFIPKHLSGEVMLGALELILSGGTYVPAMALAEGSAEALAGAQGLAADNALTALTPREREVVSLLIEGRSNKSIARRFGVTPNTVAYHVKGVFRKLDAHNRTQVVAAAIRFGWEI